MRTKILTIVTVLFITHLTTAQVLYSENFDNLTLGNVGTDFTGKTAGQGGWYTLSTSFEIPSENDNSYFKIVSEPGRGKVLELGATPGMGLTYLQKRDIDTYWNKRSPGNDILKIEFDFYTGDQFDDGKTGLTQGSAFVVKTNNEFNTNKDRAAGFQYRADGQFFFLFNSTINNCFNSSNQTSTKQNKWIKVFYYFDFKNYRNYTIIPSSNIINGCDINQDLAITSLLIKNDNNIGNQAIIPKYKYDNIVISAVDTVPVVSLQDFISSKFNLYPNPANDIVNITNNENIGVEKIDIFDISGKLVQTKAFNKEAGIQLNISDLASGTYMFHIITTEGTAIKKVVKK